MGCVAAKESKYSHSKLAVHKSGGRGKEGTEETKREREIERCWEHGQIENLGGGRVFGAEGIHTERRNEKSRADRRGPFSFGMGGGRTITLAERTSKTPLPKYQNKAKGNRVLINVAISYRSRIVCKHLFMRHHASVVALTPSSTHPPKQISCAKERRCPGG